MFKMIDTEQKTVKIIKMGEMKPCDIGRIVSKMYFGEIVMRTASIDKFEIMSLSRPGPDRCWFDSYNTKVELLQSGYIIKLTIL